MSRYAILFIAILALPLLQSCVASIPKPQDVMRDDPLIGKIVASETRQSIEFDQLIDAVAGYDVIYLSEKHDNAQQHDAQEKIIKALADKLSPLDKKPSVGFEFFAMNNTPELLNFIDAGKVEHSKKVKDLIEKDLRMKLGWAKQSDTMWRYYYDLLTLAQTEQLTVAGIDLSSTQKRRLTKKGLKGLTPLEREQIYSTRLDDDTYKTYMIDIFKAVHCGMGHGKMAERLYDSWVARNDKMALSIHQMHENGNGPVIVIVGGGHTEYNLGIIDRLNSIDPDIRQVNIALTEIRIQPTELIEYLEPLDLEGYPKTAKADYLWFFQRASYGDPCEKFKAALEKMKKSNKKNIPK